jgi:hypothetical protein
MKFLAMVTTVGLLVYSALSMALEPGFTYMAAFSLGSHAISFLDLVFLAGLMLLLAKNAFGLRPDEVPENRYILWLCLAYIVYQLAVVFPSALLLHGQHPIDVFRDLEVRLELLFIPALYSVVLRYWSVSTIVALVDAVAASLALWVVIRYLTVGGQGYYEGGVFRLRAVWGGASFLFAWLLFTSLFYWPTRLWRFPLAVLGLAGLVLANHRSGILALIAALAVQLVAMRRVTKRAVLALASIATVGTLVLYAAPSLRANVAYSLSTMLNPNADPTAIDRLSHTSLAWAYFLVHPFGDFIWNQKYYLVNVGQQELFPPHNFVIQLLDTQGIIASLIYFAIIIAVLALAWRNRRDHLSSVMLAYLTFYLVMCFFNANIDLPENVALFFLPVAIVLHQHRQLWGVARSQTAAGHGITIAGLETRSAS